MVPLLDQLGKLSIAVFNVLKFVFNFPAVNVSPSEKEFITPVTATASNPAVRNAANMPNPNLKPEDRLCNVEQANCVSGRFKVNRPLTMKRFEVTGIMLFFISVDICLFEIR